MTYDGTRSKSLDITGLERRSLTRAHEEILYRWKTHRGSDNLPMVLDENFVCVWGIFSSLKGNDIPKYYFQFINSFGSFTLNMWALNADEKLIIASENLYTLGSDGKTRGKGRQGLEGINRILQGVADSTGYTIYDIATPNAASRYLLSEDNGYSDFTESEETLLEKQLHHGDLPRWQRLMRMAKNFESKIKRYEPKSNSSILSEVEDESIKKVLRVIF